MDVAITVASITYVFDGGFFKLKAIPAGAMGRRKTDRTTSIELLCFSFYFPVSAFLILRICFLDAEMDARGLEID